MKKYIIGLGCSWTQGEGGYPDSVWQSHGGRVQVRGKSDYYLREIEHENSWVNVLCRDHFPEYEPVNLGVRGIGNKADNFAFDQPNLGQLLEVMADGWLGEF